MEAFSKMVVKGGYKVNGSENNSLKVSYLLFIDDTLIICGTNSNTIMHLRYVLTVFFCFLSTLPVCFGFLYCFLYSMKLHYASKKDMSLPGLKPFQVWKSIWGIWKRFQLVMCKIWRRRWYKFLGANFQTCLWNIWVFHWALIPNQRKSQTLYWKGWQDAWQGGKDFTYNIASKTQKKVIPSASKTPISQ